MMPLVLSFDAQSRVWMQGSKRQDFHKLPQGAASFTAPKTMQKFWTSCRLFLAPPWRKFKKGSVLVIEVGYAFSDQLCRYSNNEAFIVWASQHVTSLDTFQSLHYIPFAMCMPHLPLGQSLFPFTGV